jgi:hypothetical protein
MCNDCFFPLNEGFGFQITPSIIETYHDKYRYIFGKDYPDEGFIKYSVVNKKADALAITKIGWQLYPHEEAMFIKKAIFTPVEKPLLEIMFNLRYDFSEQAFVHALVHEMCHVKNAWDGHLYAGHGEEFKKWAKIASQKVGFEVKEKHTTADDLGRNYTKSKLAYLLVLANKEYVWAMEITKPVASFIRLDKPSEAKKIHAQKENSSDFDTFYDFLDYYTKYKGFSVAFAKANVNFVNHLKQIRKPDPFFDPASPNKLKWVLINDPIEYSQLKGSIIAKTDPSGFLKQRGL